MVIIVMVTRKAKPGAPRAVKPLVSLQPVKILRPKPIIIDAHDKGWAIA